MQMDPDHSNGFHRESDSDNSSVSEGELTPDTSGEREHLNTGSHQGGTSVVSVGEGEEDMLTITVDEEDTIE